MLRFALLVTSFVILLLGSLLAFYSDYSTSKAPDGPHHFSLVNELDHWAWWDLPIYESEELVSVAEKTLNTSNYVYRAYAKDDLFVTVWGAYWPQDSSDVLSVHQHIPDNCWVLSGWEMVEAVDGYDLGLNGSINLFEGQYRVMKQSDETMHVLYWHLVNGVPFSSGGGYNVPVLIADLVSQLGFNSRGEQFFLRLAANRPFEELILDPEFQAIAISLAENGLEKPIENQTRPPRSHFSHY